MTSDAQRNGTHEATGAFSRATARFRQVADTKPGLKSGRAYVNWLRANLELAKGSADVKARPLKLTFDPTNVCQLRCPLCPTGIGIQDRGKGHAQLHMFEHLLDELGEYLFFIDFFNWGEPLLNTHVEEFIRMASVRNITCAMSTNLSLPLTDLRIHRLVTSGLSEMIVSLDGASSETYGKYRRKGDFDLVWHNMQRIMQVRRQLGRTTPMVTWQYLVFGFNEHEIPRAKDMAREIGVDRLVLRPAFLDEGRFPLSDEDRREIASWAPASPLYQIQPVDSVPAAKVDRCGWHYMSAAVNWDGTVAPCCTTFSKQDDFGTIGKSGERSFMSVFNNAAYRMTRERFAGRRSEKVNLVCENCPTPAIMNYHEHLNRQVIIYTLIALMQSIGRHFTHVKQWWRTAPVPAFRA